MTALPDGYTVPVCRALTQPVLVSGIPKSAAVLLGMTSALILSIVLGNLSFFSFGLSAAAQAVLYGLKQFLEARCKVDPHYFDVFLQNRGPKRLVP